MLEVGLFVMQSALSVALTAWLVRFDERRLPPQMLERAWNNATFWMAVVVFGPLCLPVHFGKTRRSVMGVLSGMDALMLVLLAQVLVAKGLEAVLGE